MLVIDLATEMPDSLGRLLEADDVKTRLIPAFGLDQGDRFALSSFVDSHRPGIGFDLIIDDASHMLGPTKTSFEVLFPRLRPGGLYFVEDWTVDCGLDGAGTQTSGRRRLREAVGNHE